MIVGIVDVASLGYSRSDEVRWIFDRFGDYFLIWVFEDKPFEGPSELEHFLSESGFCVFRVLKPVNFIMGLLSASVWYHVDGFVICTRDERFIPLLDSGVRLICNEESSVDAAYFQLHGLSVDKYFDFLILSDAFEKMGFQVDEGKILSFLRRFSLDDFVRRDCQDVVRGYGWDWLLRNNFYAGLLACKKVYEIEPWLPFSVSELVGRIYGSKKFIWDKNFVLGGGVWRWRVAARSYLFNSGLLCKEAVFSRDLVYNNFLSDLVIVRSSGDINGIQFAAVSDRVKVGFGVDFGEHFDILSLYWCLNGDSEKVKECRSRCWWRLVSEISDRLSFYNKVSILVYDWNILFLILNLFGLKDMSVMADDYGVYDVGPLRIIYCLASLLYGGFEVVNK
jgi:hypothetical protein